ncbi:MAG: DNA topoisomerase VI subunit B [Myxococcota bacterium]
MATKHASRRSAKTKAKAAGRKKAAGSKKKARPAKKVAKARPKKAAKAKAEPQAEKAAPAPPEAEAAPQPPAPTPKKRNRVTAERMGEQQREISISEFFTKNRHLLGFDNASRALLTSVKEAVDNSLDACEEAGILPEVIVRIEATTEGRFKMHVEDNGPGIVKKQIPKVFGKLLYGSKFHRLRQSRGQQGIGISAAGMYGQLTTGKPTHITSKTAANKPAHHFQIIIDTTANEPKIVHDDIVEWAHKDHGTSVEIEMEAVYKGGRKSVDEYIQQVAVANPHVRIEYHAPGKRPIVYPRLTDEMPRETKAIKPHPYGVELGILQRMAQGTRSRTLGGFLQAEFSRVSSTIADEICRNAGLDANTSLKQVTPADLELIYNAIGKTKIMAPPTGCLAPIGEIALLEGLKALMVQRQLAEQETKLRKKEKVEGKNSPKQDAKATAAVESQVEKVLETVTAIEPEEDDEEDEAQEAAEAPTTEVNEGPEPITKTGVIEIFGKPCFITAVTRNPRVYRGNPFQVEAALAYGGDMPGDELASVVRLANRAPLLFQQGACSMSQALVRTNWRSYNVEQARGALPSGALLIVVHIASVWVPFTSEAKEAVAHYDEIISELKFALQECGRRLSRHIRRRRRVADSEKKARYIEKYIPNIGAALQDLLGLTNAKRDKFILELTGVLERSRKM